MAKKSLLIDEATHQKFREFCVKRRWKLIDATTAAIMLYIACGNGKKAVKKS